MAASRAWAGAGRGERAACSLAPSPGAGGRDSGCDSRRPHVSHTLGLSFLLVHWERVAG